MELRAHGIVVMAGHGTYFATLGRFAEGKRRNLLSEPSTVSYHSAALELYLRFCQFQMRMVSVACQLRTAHSSSMRLRSSELLNIHGSSWWKKTVRT